MRSENTGNIRWLHSKTVRQAVQMPRLIGRLLTLLMGVFFVNLRDASDKIIRTARRLTDTCRKAEPEFLKIGSVLQDFYADLNALVRRLKDITAKMAGNREDNVLQMAVGLSGEAGRVLDRYCRKASADLGSVDTLIGHLKTLHSACDRIDRIATNLRVVGINIGVECTRSDTTRDMFHVVAREIVAFSDSIVAVGEKIREDAREAGIHEEITRKKIISGLSELQQLSGNAEEAVRVTMREADLCMAVAEEIFNDSGRRFEEISCQVEEIVTTLQFHDNMRQRLEHTGAALADIGALIDGRPVRHETTVSGMDRFSVAFGVMSVQTGQIADVIGEIDRVNDQGTRAFERMKEEISLLVRSMMSVCDQASQGDDADPVARLIKSLGPLVLLIDRADELVAFIDESVSRAAEITKRFSRHLEKVEKISVDTHLKAINAIIKSDHLGSEGRTLEVLAKEMSAISRETDHFVLAMKNHLNRVSDFAETVQEKSKIDIVGNESANQSGKDKLNVEGEGRSLSRSIEALSSEQTRMKEQVKGVAADAERLVTGIEKNLDKLSFLPKLATEMTLHLEQLEGVADTFRRFGGGFRTADADALQMGDAYTMQRERDIHETIVVGRLPGAEIAAADSYDPNGAGGQNIRSVCLPGGEDEDNHGCEEEEALGDNVELF